MDASSLTARYVEAATRSAPEPQRVELARELRASIADLVDARVAAGQEVAGAERSVLTELGDPMKLAAEYTDRPLYVIGPRLFATWWRLLKLLLWIIVPLAFFGIALGQTLAGAPLGEIIGTTLGGTVASAIQLVFWVTLIFALVDRYGSEADMPREPWSVDQLPAAPVKSVGLVEVVGSFVGLALAAAFLLWDQLVGFVPGLSLSFFDPALWPVAVGYALGILALDFALIIVVHLAGGWNVPLAATNAVLDLALAIPAVWLLLQGALINPQFFATLIPIGSAQVHSVVAIVMGFIIAGTTVWGIIDAFLKARRGAASTL